MAPVNARARIQKLRWVSTTCTPYTQHGRSSHSARDVNPAHPLGSGRVRVFAEWLYGTAPSVAIHSTFWLIRVLQATHLLTAGVVAGSGVMIALRALGWRRADEPFATV